MYMCIYTGTSIKNEKKIKERGRIHYLRMNPTASNLRCKKNSNTSIPLGNREGMVPYIVSKFTRASGCEPEWTIIFYKRINEPKKRDPRRVPGKSTKKNMCAALSVSGTNYQFSSPYVAQFISKYDAQKAPAKIDSSFLT